MEPLSCGEREGGRSSESPEVTVFSHYKPHMTRVLGYERLNQWQIIITPSLQRDNMENVQPEILGIQHLSCRTPLITSLSPENSVERVYRI